jgi:polyhydroxyalkanoate synthesis repressor PhaR
MPVIKRYPNRKLYDTDAKQYITLEGIAEKIRKGEEIRVIDNANGEDLTAVILTQVIFEEEKKRSGLLPHTLLAGLIQASGDRLSAIQRNLASSIGFFRQVDEEIRRRVDTLISRGELSEDQGRSLLDKLLSLTAQQNDENVSGLEEEVTRAIEERKIPTRSDMDRIIEELNTLGDKLDELKKEE